MKKDLILLSNYFKNSGLKNKNNELSKIIKKSQQGNLLDYTVVPAGKYLWENYFETPAYGPMSQEEADWINIHGFSSTNLIKNQLDLVGLLPGIGVIPLLLNAAIYCHEGNYTAATICVAGAVLNCTGVPAISRAAGSLGKMVIGITPEVAGPIFTELLEALYMIFSPFGSMQVRWILSSLRDLGGLSLQYVDDILAAGQRYPVLTGIEQILTSAALQQLRKAYQDSGGQVHQETDNEHIAARPNSWIDSGELKFYTKEGMNYLMQKYDTMLTSVVSGYIVIPLNSQGKYWDGGFPINNPEQLRKLIEDGITDGSIRPQHQTVAEKILQNISNNLSNLQDGIADF